MEASLASSRGRMRALVIGDVGRYGVVDRPAPVPEAGDLLLAPIAVGICRTDLELLDGSMVYLRDGRSRLPLVPGHEWVARVVEAPADSGFAVGDRVVGECSIGCGECALCHAGEHHQCPRRRETGVMNLDGAMAGLFRFPARAAFRVPDRVDDEDAVFAEPAAVALRAVLRARIRTGERIAVIGGGIIGWLATALIRDLHEVDLAVAEPDALRRERLGELGARVADPGDEFDAVVEASGSPGGVAAGLAALAPGGRLVAVGLTGAAAVGVDLDRVVVRDQTIIGSLGSPGVWPEVLSRLGTGRVRPSTIVTARHPLDRVDAAIAEVRASAPGSGKVLVIPGDADRG